MKNLLPALLLFISINTFAQTTSNTLPTRIAFGSCASQDKPQTIWEVIIKQNPELFIFLGDNIYGDTEDMLLLKQKYEKLAAKAGYQQLQKNTPVIATWDDHDYGVNDGGKEYSKKEESKKIFLDFFKEPAGSERRKHEGIYTSYYYEQNGKRLQIIVLDLRTFRDKICRGGEDEDCVGEYIKCTDTTKTMLGEQQWKWLEGELRQPADLRIVASSTQFLVDFNGWEAWVNLPHERERFMRLIETTKANGTVFISGDLHYSELSRLKRPSGYPVYDLTSSGLTHGHSCAGENVNRIYGAYMKPNFGLLTIDWAKGTLLMEIKGEDGETKIKHLLPFAELKF